MMIFWMVMKILVVKVVSTKAFSKTKEKKH